MNLIYFNFLNIKFKFSIIYFIIYCDSIIDSFVCWASITWIIQHICAYKNFITWSSIKTRPIFFIIINCIIIWFNIIYFICWKTEYEGFIIYCSTMFIFKSNFCNIFPFLVFINTNCWTFPSHFSWKSEEFSPSFVALNNKFNFIFLFLNF